MIVFKYDFGEVGVWPMRVHHKLFPSYGEEEKEGKSV